MLLFGKTKEARNKMQGEKVSKPHFPHKPKRDGSWVFFWIAHYEDGTSLPQYDPYTLDTHIFDEVEQNKLIKFGLYPFPSNLAKRLREEKGLNVKSNIFLPRYEVNIDDDKRVIGALTTNYVKTTDYIYCPDCKKWMTSDNFSILDIGGGANKTYKCSVCDTQSYWKCPKCGKKYTHKNKTNKFICTECGVKVTGKRIQFFTNSVQERWREYKLGYQETIKGINHKTIMKILENGDVEMVYK